MSAQTGSGPMVLLSAEIPSQFLIELVRLYFTVIFLRLRWLYVVISHFTT